MAVQTTYASPVINTQAKKITAYQAVAVLLEHIAAGTGGYTMDVVSVNVDLTNTHIVTVVLTDPIPSGQVARYNLTKTAP